MKNIINNLYVNTNSKYIRINVKDKIVDSKGDIGYYLNTEDIKYESSYLATLLSFAYITKLQKKIKENGITDSYKVWELCEKPIIIKPKQLHENGIDTKRNKQIVQELNNVINSKVAVTTNNNRITFYPMFKKVSYEKGVGLELYINEKFLIDHKELESNFVNFPLYEIAKLKNRGRIQLYQFLRTYLDSHDIGRIQKINISLKKLREILNCENKYSEYKELNRRVVQPSIKKINAGTDIFIIDYFKYRGVDKVYFKICWSQQGQQKLTMDEEYKKYAKSNGSIDLDLVEVSF